MSDQLDHWAEQKIADQSALIRELSNQLTLILPMAKGYARSHQVGNNDAYIAEAETALSRVPEEYRG